MGKTAALEKLHHYQSKRAVLTASRQRHAVSAWRAWTAMMIERKKRLIQRALESRLQRGMRHGWRAWLAASYERKLIRDLGVRSVFAGYVPLSKGRALNVWRVTARLQLRTATWQPNRVSRRVRRITPWAPPPPPASPAASPAASSAALTASPAGPTSRVCAPRLRQG